jgi:hypothetical protein
VECSVEYENVMIQTERFVCAMYNVPLCLLGLLASVVVSRVRCPRCI